MYDFVKIVGSKTVELQEEVKRLNKDFDFEYVLSGDESYKELQAMVGEAQTKAKEILAEKAGGDNQGGATKKSDAVYVWLKSPAYVDKKGTLRVSSGLYHIDLAEYPRLVNLEKTVCEVFEKELRVSKIVEIAKFFGINVDKHEDDVLLDMLVKEPKLF